MKRLLLCLLILSVAVSLWGCSDFQIHGIENFNEMDCCFGLNDNLLPDNRSFLTDYPYEIGVYHYWRNSWGPIKAKTFVALQYTPEVYPIAKEACFEFYRLSDVHRYMYDTILFQQTGFGSMETEEQGYPHWFRMLGMDDQNCCLIFIGYINEDDSDASKYLAATDFPQFFQTNFGEYMEDFTWTPSVTDPTAGIVSLAGS